MPVITIESKAFKIIMDKLALIEQTIKALSLNNGHGRWIMEEDVVLLTGLSKRSLRDKRKKGSLITAQLPGVKSNI